MTGHHCSPTGGGLDLEDELRHLGRRLAMPEPANGTVSAVLARIDREPPPADADLRQRVGAWVERLRNRWRAVGVVVVCGVLAVLAVSPAGAAIRDWLGFGAVVIEQQQPPASTSPALPPDGSQVEGTEVEGTAMSLEQARASVRYPVVVPAALGEPDRVTVAPDGRMVTLVWLRPAAGPIRLDQIDGSLSPYYVKKYYDDVSFTVVDRGEALWFARSHPIVVLDPDGTERTESARASGPTLLWQRPGVTLRLEGAADQRSAVSIAESLP